MSLAAHFRLHEFTDVRDRFMLYATLSGANSAPFDSQTQLSMALPGHKLVIFR